MKRILIIDDNQAFLEALEYILNDGGFITHGLTTTKSFAYIQAINPNLILLDDILIKQLGRDFCLALKSNALTMHIPIVLMSGNSNISLISPSYKADTFLIKPFDVLHIYNVVNEYCN